MLTSMAMAPSGHQIAFSTPSSTALSLNIAIRAASEANKIKTDFLYLPGPSPSGTAYNVLAGGQVGPIFDYFEQCILASTFSFQSLESFCNHIISRRLNSPLKIRRHRILEEMSPDDIQRKLSTRDKLNRVLPQILKTASPKNRPLWRRFSKLQSIRDAAIHLKGHDQYPQAGVTEEPLFHRLLNLDPSEFPETAIVVLKHFYRSKDEYPRWLRLAPGASNQEP